MATARELQRQAVREAAIQDAAVVRFDAELRRVFRRLTALLSEAFESWDADETGRLKSTVINLTRVFALRRQARRMLKDAGFDALADEVLGSTLEALSATAVRNAKQSVTMGPKLQRVMEAWRDLRLADLLGLAEDVARSIQRVALDGTLGLRTADRLSLDVAKMLQRSERQARTVVDTAVSTFSRQMEAAQSTGKPDELFVYVGPVDTRMREFCGDWVGKVRTRKAIDTLDNGQIPNVFMTAGGWNCRHLWKRVSLLDDDLIAIAGTDERAPGIAAQVERVEAAA